MKTILFVLAGLCLPVFAAMAQSLNHPVIDKVQALYKPDQSAAVYGQPSSSPAIKVKATAGITLKSGYEATKIYLKIRDKQTQAVIYDVNYTINSADVSDQGIVLYKKEGNLVSITNPATVTLRPYVYELYTEDAGGNKSSVYTIIQ